MAPLLLIYLVLHLGAGLLLPYKPGFKPYFYKYIEDAGLDLERRLNRENRPQSVRVVRGASVGLIMGVLGALAGVVVLYVGHVPYGRALQLAFIMLCINFMTPMKVVKQVQKHMETPGELPKAGAALQPYMQELLEPTADVHTVLRKTIEFIALSLNTFLMGPVFWLLAVGPVGMAFYVTFSALQHAFGVPDPRRRYFSSFVCAVDMLLNIFPAMLTTAFLTLGALFVSRSSPARAFTTILQQSRRQHFIYQGWILTAVAGALGITLGGPVKYSPGYTEGHPWIGPPETSARLWKDDLSRAALLQYVFYICVIALVALSMILSAWR